MRKLVNRLFSVFLVLMVVAVLALAGLSLLSRGDPTNLSTWRLDSKPLVVLGGSMEPAIPIGSIVLVRRAEAADVQVGDVITFTTPSEASVTEGRAQFWTRGDANEDDDPWPVTQDLLLGKVAVHVPYIGYVSRFASTKQGLVLLLVVPGVLLAFSELYGVLRGGKKKGNPTRPAVLEDPSDAAS
jgi:signal peptidase